MYKTKKVETKKDLNAFIKYPFKLYKDNDNWVPPLLMDERTVLSPKKNPAFDHSKASLWLALDEHEEIVGRVAGIVHNAEAEEEGLVRFGWLDFIDDEAVSKLLIDTVSEWGISQGLKGIHGPLGFTDMDFEGMLVEGFDTPGTIATIYNYPYYPEHLEKLGFEKSTDWVELRSTVPSEEPKRVIRRGDIVESRFQFKSLKFNSKKEAKKYGHELFEVLNKAYAELYGFHQLTEKQIQFYIAQYLGFVVTDLLSIVVNKEGRVVGFAITMPSFTKAFQKAKGRLFPFGFIHILRALKKNDTADMYLIGVLPEYQKFGVTAIIFRDLIKAFMKRGIKTALTNQMLESNQNVLTQFNEFQADSEIYKRRRCYKKSIA